MTRVASRIGTKISILLLITLFVHSNARAGLTDILYLDTKSLLEYKFTTPGGESYFYLNTYFITLPRRRLNLSDTNLIVKKLTNKKILGFVCQDRRYGDDNYIKEAEEQNKFAAAVPSHLGLSFRVIVNLPNNDDLQKNDDLQNRKKNNYKNRKNNNYILWGKIDHVKASVSNDNWIINLDVTPIKILKTEMKLHYYINDSKWLLKPRSDINEDEAKKKKGNRKKITVVANEFNPRGEWDEIDEIKPLIKQLNKLLLEEAKIQNADIDIENKKGTLSPKSKPEQRKLVQELDAKSKELRTKSRELHTKQYNILIKMENIQMQKMLDLTSQKKK